MACSAEDKSESITQRTSRRVRICSPAVRRPMPPVGSAAAACETQPDVAHPLTLKRMMNERHKNGSARICKTVRLSKGFTVCPLSAINHSRNAARAARAGPPAPPLLPLARAGLLRSARKSRMYWHMMGGQRLHKGNQQRLSRDGAYVAHAPIRQHARNAFRGRQAAPSPLAAVENELNALGSLNQPDAQQPVLVLVLAAARGDRSARKVPLCLCGRLLALQWTGGVENAE